MFLVLLVSLLLFSIILKLVKTHSLSHLSTMLPTPRLGRPSSFPLSKDDLLLFVEDSMVPLLARAEARAIARKQVRAILRAVPQWHFNGERWSALTDCSSLLFWAFANWASAHPEVFPPTEEEEVLALEGPGYTEPAVKAQFVHCEWMDVDTEDLPLWDSYYSALEEQVSCLAIARNPLPPVSWEDLSSLCAAVDALAEAETLELFSELPVEFPPPPPILGGLAYFRARRQRVLQEREELLRQSLPKAFAAASATRCSIPLKECSWSKGQVFVACSPVSSEQAESSAEQAQQREESGIPTILQVRKRLKERDKALTSTSGKKFFFKEAGESRTIEGGGVELSESDVFHRMGIVKNWRTPDHNKTFTACVRPIEQETVRMPRLRADEKLQGVPIFSSLPRCLESLVRKLLEAGWKNTSSVCTDLLVQSHVGVGTPLTALLTIVDSRTDNATEALLCGAFIYLGNDVAKFLSTPLINFPLSKEIEDINQYVGGLKLITYLNNIEGFHEGTPLFSYGTVEFQEHRPVVSSVTRTRESWDDLCRNNERQGYRVQAGFNTIQPIEKDTRPTLPDFPEFDLVCAPRAMQRSILVGQAGAQPPLGRSTSVRIPGFGMSGGQPRFSVDRGRVSRQSDVAEAGVRHDTNLFTACSPCVLVDKIGDLVYSSSVNFPKDAKKGASITSFDLHGVIDYEKLPAYWKWWECNMAAITLTFEFETPAAPYSGLAFGITVDWFNHLDITKLANDYAPEVLSLLPTNVFSLRSGGVQRCSFNTDTIAGHSFSALKNAFSYNPKIYAYIYTTNQIVMAADWSMEYRIYADVVPTTTFLRTPYCTWPPELGETVVYDRWLPTKSFALGANVKQVRIPLTLGSVVETGKGKAISAPRALLSAFQSFGGILHGTYLPTSSIFVNAEVVVAMVHADEDLALGAIWRIPHVKLDSTGCDFQIPIRSNYCVTPFRAQTAAEHTHLVFYLAGGVTAPADVTAAFEFCVKINKISNLQLPMRVVEAETWFAWFALSSFTKDAFEIRIPTRIVDLKADGATIEHQANPFSHLIASTGLMSGKCDLEFTWDWAGTYGTHQGVITFMTGYGSDTSLMTYGRNVVVPVKTCRWVEEYCIGSFSGATTSAGGTEYSNYIRVQLPLATKLTSVRVNIRPHRGFSFYGPSVSKLI